MSKKKTNTIFGENFYSLLPGIGSNRTRQRDLVNLCAYEIIEFSYFTQLFVSRSTNLHIIKTDSI